MNVKGVDAINAVNTLFNDLFYDITEEEYQIKFSPEKLLKNVYITGRLVGIPIFGSKEDEDAYPEKVITDLGKLYSEIGSELKLDISFLDYKTFSPLQNLPSVYLNIAPLELLQPYV